MPSPNKYKPHQGKKEIARRQDKLHNAWKPRMVAPGRVVSAGSARNPGYQQD